MTAFDTRLIAGSILIGAGVVAGVLDDNNPLGFVVGVIGLIVAIKAWLAQDVYLRATMDEHSKNSSP